jgi:hypothetical protein
VAERHTIRILRTALAGNAGETAAEAGVAGRLVTARSYPTGVSDIARILPGLAAPDVVSGAGAAISLAVFRLIALADAGTAVGVVSAAWLADIDAPVGISLELRLFLLVSGVDGDGDAGDRQPERSTSEKAREATAGRVSGDHPGPLVKAFRFH